MTVRQLLQTCRDEKREIIILEEKRDTLRASLLPRAIRPQAAQVQTSPSNVFDAVQASIFDINCTIEGILTDMYRREETAHRLIGRLPDPRHRQMLILYYLSFREIRGRQYLYNWEQVARQMNYSVDSIYKFLDAVQPFLYSEV